MALAGKFLCFIVVQCEVTTRMLPLGENSAAVSATDSKKVVGLILQPWALLYEAHLFSLVVSGFPVGTTGSSRSPKTHTYKGNWRV